MTLSQIIKALRNKEERPKCKRCGGKGSWLMPGDAHKSEGWVPCHSCGGTGYEKEMKMNTARKRMSVLDKVALEYLVRERRYWLLPEDKYSYGIAPNQLCLDYDNKIALGIIFQSGSGPDYPIGSRLMDILTKLEHSEHEMSAYVAAVFWNNSKPFIAAATTLTTLKHRLAPIRFRPASHGYASSYTFLDEELKPITEIERPKLPW